MKTTTYISSTVAMAAILCIPLQTRAQGLELPSASQAAEVRQQVGVTDITITYHRPLVKGRKIWGGLVPFGQVWRAGANENTTIEVSTPVSVEGKALPAGKYGLHMMPNADTWTIIFSKFSQAWGSFTYSQAEDALRVDVKSQPTEMEEALEFSFEDVKPDSAVATLKWEKLAVPFRISVDEPATVVASIKNQLRGVLQYSWEPLNAAAQYCAAKNTDVEDGLKWADRSIQTEERFENLNTKAELLQAMNRTDEAQKIHAHAMEIAKPIQIYSAARGMQAQGKGDDAMKLFQELVKRSPEGVYGHLAQARLKSAAGKYDAALADAKAAQAAAPSDPQKKAIQGLIDRLQAKQDINK
jgi:tetratricopeptide (TPR) repeat protein